MKKSAIAGIVVALGAIWTGAAWYTGKKAEAVYKQMVEESNVELKAAAEGLGVDIGLELMSFERGVFSSIVRSRITFTLPSAGGEPARERELVMVEHMSHGPFPFSNLKSGNIAPAMTAVDFALEENDTVKAWFAAAKGAVPLSGRYSVSYGKHITGKLDLAPLEIVKDTKRVAFSGMKGDYEFATSTKRGVFSLASDSLELSGPSDHSDITGMAFRGITLTSDTMPAPHDMLVGSQTVTFKDWTITSKETPPVQFKDTSIAIDVTEANEAMGGKLTLDFGMINVQSKDMAGLKLAVHVQNLDAKALDAVNSVYEASSRRMMQRKHGEAGPEFTDEEEALIKTSIEQLLAGNPKAAVAPLEVRTANGTSTFNLNLDLAKPAALEGELPDMLMQAVHKLNAKLVLSKGNLADLLAIQPPTRGVPAEQAMQTAKSQVEMLGAMATAMGLGKVEDNNIVSYLNYADGRVDFNGKKMPLQEFMTMVTSGVLGGMR